jgi:hypothetical protein
MAQPLDKEELVSFKEMLLANSKMVDALVQLLIERGCFLNRNSTPSLRTWMVNTRQESGSAHDHQNHLRWTDRR